MLFLFLHGALLMSSNNVHLVEKLYKFQYFLLEKIARKIQQNLAKKKKKKKKNT